MVAVRDSPLGPDPANPPASIEDQVLGWIKVYNYKGATLPITLDHRVYSPAQLSIAQLFTNWMQASYLPKGALGDVLQVRNARLSPYNRNTAAEPNAYGALAKLYTQLKYDANKKIVPLTSDAFMWGMEANGPYGSPLATISTPEHYYLTLPTFEQQGYGPELDKAADVSHHPVLKQFPTLFVRDSSSGNKRLVVLTKDRRHPYVTITKGEYLQALEAAVARKYSEETQKIARENKGNQKSIDYFMGYLNRYREQRVAVLTSNKENTRPVCRRRPRSGRKSLACCSRTTPMCSKATAATRGGCPSTRSTRAWSNSPRPTRLSGSSCTGRRT